MKKRERLTWLIPRKEKADLSGFCIGSQNIKFKQLCRRQQVANVGGPGLHNKVQSIQHLALCLVAGWQREPVLCCWCCWRCLRHSRPSCCALLTRLLMIADHWCLTLWNSGFATNSGPQTNIAHPFPSFSLPHCLNSSALLGAGT